MTIAAMPMTELHATYATLGGAVEDLTRRGFTERFRAVGGRLRALSTGEIIETEDLLIREYHRFEGISDPDDTAIVYALESTGGVRGTVADAYGVYADPAMSAVLEGVPIREAEMRHDPKRDSRR